jgi:hypothetical protein
METNQQKTIKIIVLISILLVGVMIASGERLPIRVFTTAGGLGSSFVDGVFRDSRGFLWFSTRDGLSRFDGSRFITFQDGDRRNVSLQAEFCFAKLRFARRFRRAPEFKRRIISKRRDSFYKDDKHIPPIFIGGLRVAGVEKKLSELGEIEISNLEFAAGENNLQIDFFGIDFKPGEALRYQFMLEGADKNWNAPNAERRINYARLSAGKYRFLVRAVNTGGALSEKTAVVSFECGKGNHHQHKFAARGFSDFQRIRK